MQKGLLLVVSGPSGCGKGTVLKEVMQQQDLYYSVSLTTRAPRPGEVDGDGGMAVDATCGRKTKCVLVMDSGHIVLSALQPETIENRVTDNPSAGGKEDD